MSLFAGVLQKNGVKKGDRVLIYMPMIPEAIVAMLATARLGAIHSLVFGGFASRELSTRIEHAKVGRAFFPTSCCEHVTICTEIYCKSNLGSQH